MNYPRTLVHEGLTGAGAPLITSLGIDTSIADKYARFSMACLQPGFLYLHPQRKALDLIRAKNPAIKILVHFPIHTIWGTPNADNGYQSKFAAICAAPNGVHPGTKTPNICDNARRGEMLDLWSEVLDSGAFDGVMLDPTCAVDGCGPLEQQRAALGSIFATLRNRFPNAIILGCGGPKPDFPVSANLNGYWLENWPHQNPAGWDKVTRLCMDGGYMYAAPHLQVIAMARSSLIAQDARYGLGTSCLFDGVFAYGPPDWKGSAHLDWRIPEMDPLGWLGQPIGAPWATAGGLWTRSFEGGEVTVNTVAKDATFTRKP